MRDKIAHFVLALSTRMPRWKVVAGGFFVLFVIILVLYDVLVETFPLQARSAPADIHTKSVVDLVKKHALGDSTLGLVEELLEVHDEITTKQIGKFPFSADEPNIDSWGNPVLIRFIKSESGTLSIGVYSKGPDRYSATRGNDADDISSWASVDNAFWRQARRRFLLRRWVYRIGLAAVLTAVTLAFYSGYRSWRRVPLR